jgi:hypothetical protein
MKSKLSDMSFLAKNNELRSHVPTTRPYTQSAIDHMLEHHSIVYVKPDCSLKGIGVIRIDKKPEHYILRVQDTKKSSTHLDLTSLWNTLNRVKRKQSYIIQQGICSVTVSEKPFDVRVHLIRVEGKWHVGGMIGKVAPKENIVTNGSAGAFPALIDDLLTSNLGLTLNETTDLKNQLKTVSINAAKTMNTKYPHWCEFGLDVGIDANRNVWIYEINTLPGATGFKEIDRPSYHRIRSLRKRAS